MTADATWDFRDSASKDRLLAVLRREIDEMLELVAEPARWHTPTACTGWEVRDMVGHLLDATESYLAGFEIARCGATAPEPIGVAGMANESDAAARAYRSVPREELLARLHDDTDRLMQEFASLSDADWSGLIVADRYMGQLPAMIVVVGLLGGYTVHSWDVREGLDAPHGIAGDAADLLVPFDRIVIASGAAYRFGLGALADWMLDRGLARAPGFAKLFSSPALREWFYYRARRGTGERIAPLARPGQVVMVIGDAARAGKSKQAIASAFEAALLGK